MAAIVEKLRAQCRIDTDDATDDELLMLYFRAACRKAENFINRKLYEETVPEGDPEGVLIADDVLLALMLLVGHWYENRGKFLRCQQGTSPVWFFFSAGALSFYSFVGGDMQAGRLRDRVIILNVTTARSPSGHPVETVTEGATVWAEVKGISGREIISGGAETAQATVRVWMRFRRDVTATSRLKVLTGAFKGAILGIEGPPIPDARATRLEILCSLKGNV
ncbi:putative prophage head-tail adaptor [Escherichia coli]|nr:putative prophage head-tail adaptor [Escherichia coli]